jgi:hypothetical protein
MEFDLDDGLITFNMEDGSLARYFESTQLGRGG